MSIDQRIGPRGGRFGRPREELCSVQLGAALLDAFASC